MRYDTVNVSTDESVPVSDNFGETQMEECTSSYN